MKVLLVIASILLAAKFSEAGMGYNGGSNGGYNGGYNGGSNPNQQGQYYFNNNQNQNDQYYASKNQPEEPSRALEKPPPKPTSGLGISAWGIIGIIIGLAVLVTLGYFACELYPFMNPQKQTPNSMEMAYVA